MYKNMLTNEDTETALQSSGGAMLSLKGKKRQGFLLDFESGSKLARTRRGVMGSYKEKLIF